MRTWVGRLRRMRASDYLTATEVLTLAVWVEIAIRVMPFSRVVERMTRGQILILAGARETRKNQDLTPNDYRRLLRFVAVAYDVLPLPATCLRRSLVLHALLERRGVPSRLRFGVAKRGPAFAAHAWVECDGVTPDSTAAGFGEMQTHRS